MLTIYIWVGTDHISKMAEGRGIIFCTQVGYIESQHTYDRSPLKGAWSGHVTRF